MTFFMLIKIISSFSTSNKSMKKVNKVHPKVCHISAAAEKQL